jgi:hypothetical protein
VLEKEGDLAKPLQIIQVEQKMRIAVLDERAAAAGIPA